MDDFIRYYVMYDNPIRDEEPSVVQVSVDLEQAKEYVEKNPTTKGWAGFPDSENYVVKATTTYERIEKQ